MWRAHLDTSKDSALIVSLIKSLHNGEENFELTEEGNIDKYLGVEIKNYDDGSFELSQPFLIKWLPNLLVLLLERASAKDTPVRKPSPNKDLDGNECKQTWQY